MRFGPRSLGTVARALTQGRHYRAVWNLVRDADEPGELLTRYLSGRGAYPRTVSFRTPGGTQRAVLYSHHDLLTLNEIFFRLDYAVGPDARVVVDVGSNIGLSALFFLTRNPAVQCHLFEPLPTNAERLRRNLDRFQGRYVLEEVAVADVDGEVPFRTEATGRYGGIAADAPSRVRCRHINSVLRDVLELRGRVDVLKIDTEGAEPRTVGAIDDELLGHIGEILVEGRLDDARLDRHFEATRYGPITHLTRITPSYPRRRR